MAAALTQFLTELKPLTDWYEFGIFLGVPPHDLDKIAARFESRGVTRCLVQVYEKYRDSHGPPSWQMIAKALKAMDKVTLANDISKKYLHLESDSESVLSDGSVDSMDKQESHIFIDDKVKDEFDILCTKYSAVLLSVKKALQTQKVDIDDLQDVIQDHCGLEPLPSDSATLDSVFQRMKQQMSCFDVSLLKKVINLLVKPFQPNIEKYCEDLNAFKSSTLMKQIVEEVKRERKASSDGTKVVALKVSQAWTNTTIWEFERLVNIVLHEKRLSKIQVREGCICVTWVVPDTGYNIVYDMRFMDAIAVLSLSIGDEEIYGRQDQSDTPVSLDSALLQAIEKGVIDAVELLLAVGANPYLSLPSGDEAISAIVNMRDEDGRTVLHSAYRHADVTSLLLCESCDPNVVDNVRSTPIMVASKYGYCDTVVTLIGAGADVNQDGLPGTPLIAAAGAGHDNVVTTLIGADADVNKANHTGTTPLIVAVKAGHNNIVATLIGAGADVNKADDTGTTPLIVAGHDNIVSTLIDAGADVNKADDTGTTPLIVAGHDNIVSTLIDAGADVNKADDTGTTLLIAAAWAGHDNIVATLIGAGADVNQDGLLGTPLIAAAGAGHDNVVTTLIGADADVNKAGCNTDAPLIAAARAGHNYIVAILIGAGADVNKANHTGTTPLIVAAKAGHDNIVASLIGAGADVNKANHTCTTPLRAAVGAGHDNIVGTLIGAGAIDYMSIIDACSTGNNHLLQQLLLHPNINIDQQVNGDTPLFAAIKHNHPSIVTTLLLYGADPNVPNRYGIMPLVMACRKGNKKIVQSLLQHNANVDHHEWTGDTPLIVASKYGFKEIIQLLLEWGADVDAKNMYQETAFSIATRHGDIANIFESCTILSSGEYQQLVSPSSDSQSSSQNSLDGHCNSSAGNYSNISYMYLMYQRTCSRQSIGRGSIGGRSEGSGYRSIGQESEHSHGSNRSRIKES